MEKLQRQRALLQEHLRWLDSEIAAEASTVPARAPEAPVAVPLETPSELRAPQAGLVQDSIDIPEPDVRGIHSDVRSGCVLYFAIAAAGLGLVVAYIYLRY